MTDKKANNKTTFWQASNIKNVEPTTRHNLIIQSMLETQLRRKAGDKIVFNMEELALIAAADTKQRSEAIKEITFSMTYAEDEISSDMLRICVEKLKAISDEEFAALDLSEAKQFD